MDCYEILGISPTKDVKEIRKAYSKLLTQYSPEKDPEGFQRLRAAYEEAAAKAREDETNTKELSPVDKFMADFEAIYKCFEKRLDIGCWRELLESDICCQIDTSKEVSKRILNFIMTNYNFPWEIWSLFNEHFSWASKKDTLYNEYPRNFIDFVVYKINSPGTFDYEYLRNCSDNRQDEFILEFRKITDAIESFDLYTAAKSIKAAQEICHDHPNLQILNGRYLALCCQMEKAEKVYTDYISSYGGDVDSYFFRGELYFRVGRLEEAFRDYRSALDIKPSSSGVLYSLGKCSMCLEKYEDAVDYFEKFYKVSANQEIRTMLNSAYNFYIDKLTEETAQNSLDSQVKYKLAEAYFKTSRYDESCSLLNELYESSNFTGEMYYLFVRVLMAQNNIDLAYTTVCKAVELYKDNYGLNFIKADLLDIMERPEESAAQYDRAIEVGGEVSSAYNNKAFVLNKLGRYSEALEAVNKSISLDPGAVHSYKNKAAALLGLGHYEDCLEACEEALYRNQYLVDTYITKIDALIAIKLYDEAMGVYSKAIDLGIKDGRLYYEKARLLMFRGQYDDGITYCNHAIELDENNADFYYIKGLCNYYKESYDSAIDMFNEVIRRKSNYETAYFYKAQSYNCSSRQNEALAVLDEAIATNQQHPDRFHDLKGEIYEEQNETEKAITEYKNALNHDPSSSKYLYELGHAYNDLDNYNEALKYFEMAIELNPSESNYYVSKSYSLFRLKNYKDCVMTCNKAIELDPDNIAAHQNKGWALFYSNNIMRAEEECNIALKLDGNKRDMLLLKLRILEFKKLYQDAVIVSDRMLELDPKDQRAKDIRAELLNKLNNSKKGLFKSLFN